MGSSAGVLCVQCARLRTPSVLLPARGQAAAGSLPAHAPAPRTRTCPSLLSELPGVIV